MPRSGADLALLLLGGFRFMAAEATDRLASRGYPDVRPAHDFALRAVAAGATSASEVGRRTSVSKQAAAKTTAFLLKGGYVHRQEGPRGRLEVTDRGRALMHEGEAVFDELRSQWQALVGDRRVADLQDALEHLLGTHADPTDATDPTGRADLDTV